METREMTENRERLEETARDWVNYRYQGRCNMEEWETGRDCEGLERLQRLWR